MTAPGRRRPGDDFEELWQRCVDPDALGPLTASMAGVWDCLRHGMHNTSADRDIAHRLLQADPGLRRWAGAHRRFRAAAITEVLQRRHPHQYRQFLDLGCGFPDIGSTPDELIASSRRGLRLVCVDNDPIVVNLLADLFERAGPSVRGSALAVDLHHPDEVLRRIVEADVIDLGQPVVVIVTAVLQHLDDAAAFHLLAAIRDNVVTGSLLLLSHPSAPAPTALTTGLPAALSRYEAATGPLFFRGIGHAGALLGAGWTPRPPGVLPVGIWAPGPATQHGPGDLDPALAGVAGWAVLAEATPVPPRPHGMAPPPDRIAHS